MLLKELKKKVCSEPKLSLFDSAALVNKSDWNNVLKEKNLYLSLEFLTALEDAKKDDMEFRYIIYYNSALKPVAIAYIQLVHFIDKGLKYQEIFCKLGNKLKNKFLESIEVKALVCGNIFASGENGFMFTSDIEPSDAFNLLAGSMKRLTQDEDKNGQISFSLMKDFWPKSITLANNLKNNSYRGFEIDVNMVLKIHPDWKKMDDYFSSMNAKFRTKAKGVYKKSEAVRVKIFELNDIIKHKERIETLYLSVLNQADYKFGELNATALINFKRNLSEKFLFKGYFLKETLIGFSIAFYLDTILDANMVGLDYDYNKEYAVYQRMLYDFVEESLHLRVKELRLGRTAEQIKSSLGAEPVDMKLYIKHRNRITNKLLAPIISSITPSKFELRAPFRKEFAY